MGDFIIRRATTEDAEAAFAVMIRSIREICAPFYDHDDHILSEWLGNKTPTNVRNWIDSQRSFSVVAIDSKGSAVGFAMLSGSEIVLNYVVPEVLHQGIGKRMLEALEQHALACGMDRIDVVSSIPAKAFYERNGYFSSGAPKYVGRILGDFPLGKRIR
jgi:GNAT superfamily N-acetyltransferase